jgi:hypothetical protein
MMDYLKECIVDPALVSGPTPIDQFSRFYCVRCARTDCSRSIGNNFSLAKRAKNWHHDLFEAPRRASENDQTFAHIRAKLFISAPEQLSVSTKVFSEVPDKKPPEPTIVAKTEPPIPVPPAPPIPELETPIQPPIPATAAVPTPQTNTPFSQGTTLGGAPESSQDVILEPGGVYKFGQ